MSVPPGADEVRGILAAAGRPGALRSDSLPPDLGSPARTHVYVLDDVVVKIEQVPVGRVARERQALGWLQGSGLPVPEIVETGELADGRPWMVMTRLPGEPPACAVRMAHEVDARLAGQMGSIAARVHAVVPPEDGMSAVNKATRLTDVLSRMAADAGIVDESEWRHAVSLLDAQRPALESAPRRLGLGHRDLQARNVLVDRGGTLVALLDFEAAGRSDPAEDFNRLGLDWTAPGFVAFRDAYATAGGALGTDAAERVAYHVLTWALVAFAYLGAYAPPYLPAARAAIARFEAGERPDLPGG